MKIVWIILGFISLFLGLLGIVLPVLPTTPFLLLTLYLFAKGSNRFHRWFVSTKIYKKYLHDFVQNRTMTKKQKWTLMISVDFILLISFIVMANLWIRILLIVLLITKYIYFQTQVKTT